MLYIIAIILGVIAGIIAKGKITNLLNIKFKKKWTVLSAFIIQAGARIMILNGFNFILKYNVMIQIVVYCLLLLGFWFNRRYAGVLVIGAGCFLNIAVMALNSGKMPVNKALAAAVINDESKLAKLIEDGRHMLADGNTKLVFLSDIIHPPGLLGYGAQIVSIGDLAVVTGLFLFVFGVVVDKKMEG